MSSFADLCRMHRAKKRMTQTELGNAVGVSRQTIYSIESGEGTKLDIALRIANKLDFSLDAIKL